jgi:hypothetical protein
MVLACVTPTPECPLIKYSALECLRISSRTVFETEYDVNSDLFRMQKLCLRFLIYELLEIFRIDNQHGLCAKKCLKAGRIFIRRL